MSSSPNTTSLPQQPSDAIDPRQYPTLAKISHILRDDSNHSMENLFCELSHLLKKGGSVIKVNDRRNHEHCWVRVPVNDSRQSFVHQAKHWLGQAIQYNSANVGEDEAVRRIFNFLMNRNKETVVQILKEKKLVVGQMNEADIVACFKDAKVKPKQAEILLRHMRSHFGPKSFAPRQKIRDLRATSDAVDCKEPSINSADCKVPSTDSVDCEEPSADSIGNESVDLEMRMDNQFESNSNASLFNT